MNTNYDLVILGAGPAGLAASVYASRFKINHLVIGKMLGGSAAEAHQVENWPGEKSILGADLMKKFADHATSLGAEIKQTEVKNIAKTENGFELDLENEEKINAKNLLLAFGTERRKLNIPGEAEFLGKGVSYCSTCDGAFFKNKIVTIVGGGNAGATAALALADHAEKVYIIFPEPDLIAEAAWADKVKTNQKIIILPTNTIKEIKGAEKVENIVLEKPIDNQAELKTDGLFIEAGSVPSTSLIKSLGINLDEQGFIHTEGDGKTNISGVWAAGDISVSVGDFRQILTAAAEGAIAVNSLHQTLKKS